MKNISSQYPGTISCNTFLRLHHVGKYSLLHSTEFPPRLAVLRRGAGSVHTADIYTAITPTFGEEEHVEEDGGLEMGSEFPVVGADLLRILEEEECF